MLYPNGYARRRRLVLPPQGDLAADTLIDFPLLVRLSGAWLTAAAGRLLSLAGGRPRDLRFELEDGTKLSSWLVAHDGAAGTAVLRVRLPSWQTRSQLRLWLYYGKAGLAVAEDDVAGVWRGAMAVIDPVSGVDLSGNGRGLKPGPGSAAPLAGTLDGMPAGVYDADSFLRANAPLWVNGLADLSLEAVVRLSSLAEGSLVRLGGPAANSARAIVFADEASFIDAGRTHCWSYGCGRAGQHETGSGPKDSLSIGRQHLHAVFADGEPVELFVGEERLDGVRTPATPLSGALVVTAADNLSLGAGTGVQARAAVGAYLPLIVWPRALSPTWIAIAARNQAEPASVVGIGDEDTPADNVLSPVAVPLRQAITAEVDIDVLAACFDPQGPAGLDLDPPGAGLNGAYSLAGSKIRCAPQGGFVGLASVDYTVRRGGLKLSTSRILLSVTLAGTVVTASSQDEEPDFTRTFTVGFSQLGATQFDTPAAAQAAATPGTRILLNPSPTSYGALTLTRGGSPALPVFWDVRNGQWGEVRWAPSLNADDIWVRGIDVGAARISIAGARCRLWRSQFAGFDAGTDIQVLITGPDVFFCYNQLGDSRSRGVTVSAKNGALRATIGRNRFHDLTGQGNTHETLQVGQDPSTRETLIGALVAENLFERCNPAGSGEDEPIGLKGSGNTVRGNTLLDSGLISNRHGAKGNNILSNWCEGGAGCGIRLNDRGRCAGFGIVAGNRVIGGKGIMLVAGDATPDGYVNGCFPAATDWLLVGNQADKLLLGLKQQHHGQPLCNVANTRIEANQGAAPSLAQEAGTVQVALASIPFTPARKLAAAEVGPQAPWARWPVL